MKKHLIIFIIAFLFSCNDIKFKENIDVSIVNNYVNPLIGTTGENQTEYGGMIPGVTMPFGMTQWSAMTRENQIGSCPYHYADDKIIGFIGTHQPAIWMGDYGFISIMPQINDFNIRSANRSLPFSHKEEITKPHYYSVNLNDKNGTITTELTSSKRCGFFKITFPENQNPYITIEMSRLADYEGFVKILPDKNQIIGYNSDRHNKAWGKKMGPELKNFKGYFVLEFDTDFINYGTYSDTSYSYATSKETKVYPDVKEITGSQVGAYIAFAKNCRTIKIKIASSFISLEQAKQNLKKEIVDWNFDQIKNNCHDTWESYLKRIEIEGGTPDQKVNFYTSMYHSMLYPRTFSEYGKYYSAFDDKVHKGVSYNDYSLWDTYRALHPLLLFTAPEHVSPMITSLLQMYEESGWLPKWPNPTFTNIMIGSHADAVIADAYIKGFRDFDVDLAYEAMYKNAMTPPQGDSTKKWHDRANWTSYEARGGLTWYKKLGFVPADKTSESVSRTLEFAFNDFCIAQMANVLEKTEDYENFSKRSQNYINVFNPEIGFMQPKLSDYTFYSGDPRKYSAFTEGSPWTYLFSVIHDVDGLIKLMGGKQKFIDKLDENFNSGHYRHDNEPGHHYAYLYNYVGQSWKTQELVKEILNTKYKNQPNGLCGNDDCGQMSAWYIFSSLGFYPVCPGSDEYALGAPLFEKITLNLNNVNTNKSFTIIANNLSKKNIYVKQVKLDGRILNKPFITHSEIMNGKKLEFEMTSNPN